MAIPFFYIAGYNSSAKEIMLEEDSSRHIVQVLRMKEGELLNLTDGKGNLLTCEISEPNKKHCAVRVLQTINPKRQTRNVTIAISLLKNTSRFEWFLEKATEIGVNEIIPLICERTEKQKFRYERMNAVCISAMLQSQQSWLPVLNEPVPFNHQTIKQFIHQIRFIAHCEEAAKSQLTNQPANPRLNDSAGQESTIILIGPEGDFSPREIELALQNGFLPVSLGETRLRTETAGVVAAALLCHI